MPITPSKLRLSKDATDLVTDHLKRDPASLLLITAPFGSFESLVLTICEKEPEKWPIFRQTNLFESILKITNSDVGQEMVT
jgi:hypothetical protein